MLVGEGIFFPASLEDAIFAGDTLAVTNLELLSKEEEEEEDKDNEANMSHRGLEGVGVSWEVRPAGGLEEVGISWECVLLEVL
jgi:hypothetical protein